MRRYWIGNLGFSDSDKLNLTDDLFHHIVDVCRQDIGSRFEVLNNESKAFLVEITERGKKSAQIKLLEERIITPIKKPFIHLVLSIPKFSTLENVLEKSVELGVNSLIPITTEFSFIKNFSTKDWEHKFQRWQKIIISATQQSGRGELMKLESPRPFKNFLETLNRNPQDLSLFLYEGDSQNNIKHYINKIKSSISQPIENIYIIIGSEGGFSVEEVRQLELQGLSPVTLGEQILRVETACITAVSVLKYEFDLMGGLSK